MADAAAVCRPGGHPEAERGGIFSCGGGSVCECAPPCGFLQTLGDKIMSGPMQWFSLIAGIVILGYGMFRLLDQPRPAWIPMILGLLIVAFSVSAMVKSRGKKGNGSRRDGKP